LLLDTSTSFIQRLGQHDPNAWDQFTTKYGWMMRRWIENDGDIALLKLTAANDGEKAYVPMRTLAASSSTGDTTWAWYQLFSWVVPVGFCRVVPLGS
jgi:hypothetical protein